MGSLIYLLSTRVDLYFENISSNPGKIYFEGLVHLLRYITNNKNLSLMFYAKIENAPLSDLLRQDIINTENQFMVFSDSTFQDCPYTGRSTRAYIFFNRGGTIDYCTHILGPVAQYSA